MNSTPLKGWNERLHAHFSWLRSQRDILGAGRPIFALEHGLAEDERRSLADAVRDGIARGLHPRVEWLPYVVYATELGYHYAGDEFWQTFEAESPGWRLRGDRSYIRRKFRTFADEFGGAVPSGPWAEHFTIIAWPITHAILPTDLQRHLARLLYETRYEISVKLLSAPDQLGRRLASRAFYASSRFQKFAENSGLLGLVAAALLSEEQEESPALLRSTLDRIVEDLSSERQSKTWLKSARRNATAVRVRGLTRSSSGAETGPAGQRDAAQRPAATDPTLWLRRRSEGWVLEMELPDLSELGSRLPRVQEELSRKRCRVSGRRQPLARGQLLHPGQRVILDSSPEPSGSILEIENGSPEAAELLRDHCLLSPSPWLLRLQGEATVGRQIRSRVVRTGSTYLYVTPDSIPYALPPWMTEVPLSTDGLCAYALAVPQILDASSRSIFVRLGLTSSAELSIAPVGVVAADWDSEGVATWMVGEDPVLAVQSSRHPVHMTVTVGGSPTSVDWPGDQSCVFLRFDPMEVGTHKIGFRVAFADATPPVDGEVWAIIRARPSGTLSSRYGLRLLPTPAQPYLTELWEGDAYLEVLGPAAAEATVKCELRGRNADRSLATCSFRIGLPAGKAAWLQSFRRHVRENAEAENAYDDADVCCISVFHPDVGFAELTLERPFTPLRWSLRSSGAVPIARLINNSSIDAPSIDLFTQDTPHRATVVRAEADTVQVKAAGLLVASAGECSAEIILPPEVRTLADLQRISELPDLACYSSRSAATIWEIVKACGRWLAADLPANLAAERLLHTVVRGFTGRLCELVGGHRWSRVERQWRDDPEDLRRSILVEAMGRHSSDQQLASEVWRDLEHLRSLEPEQRAEALTRKLRHSIRVGASLSLDATMLELVLQLASEPGRLMSRSNSQADAAITLILERPLVLRAARMSVLCIHAAEEHDDGSVYRGWTWQ